MSSNLTLKKRAIYKANIVEGLNLLFSMEWIGQSDDSQVISQILLGDLPVFEAVFTQMIIEFQIFILNYS